MTVLLSRDLPIRWYADSLRYTSTVTGHPDTPAATVKQIIESVSPTAVLNPTAEPWPPLPREHWPTSLPDGGDRRMEHRDGGGSIPVSFICSDVCACECMRVRGTYDMRDFSLALLL